MSGQPDHRTIPSRPAWWPSGWWPGGRNAAQRTQASERLRSPQPLVRTRLPSGRGAMEQPNVTGDGDAALTPRFWLRWSLHRHRDRPLRRPVDVDPLQRPAPRLRLPLGRAAGSAWSRRLPSGGSSSLIAGPFGGVAWYLIRRYTKGESSEIDDVDLERRRPASFRRSLGTSVISEIVIGMGASIGREAAPKLMGGGPGSVLATWAGLTPAAAPAARRLRRRRRPCRRLQRAARRSAVHRRDPRAEPLPPDRSCPRWPARRSRPLTAWLYLPDHATYIDIPASSSRMRSSSGRCWSALSSACSPPATSASSAGSPTTGRRADSICSPRWSRSGSSG